MKLRRLALAALMIVAAWLLFGTRLLDAREAPPAWWTEPEDGLPAADPYVLAIR